MKFLDEAKIYVRSGNGGPGCLSFRREKFIEYGGPDGGNGGCGGNVIVEVKDNLNTLIDFRYRQHFKAQNGLPGMGRDRSGPKGEDVVMHVPVGTQILADDKETVLYDLTEAGQRVVMLRGGDGGFGNAHFKSSTNRSPRRADEGWPGAEMWIWLRLKLIADVGVVGLPNAGKSTLLSVVTAAKPKIADYPFTTLHPNLGVITYREHSFVMADIPGLIEGAHAGYGLGTRFLGHVERCAVLIHMVDATQDDVGEAYRIIRGELSLYGGGLVDRPEIVVLNKIDAVDSEELAAKVAALSKAAQDAPVVAISAATHVGLDPLLGQAWHAVDDRRRQQRAMERDQLVIDADPPEGEAP